MVAEVWNHRRRADGFHLTVDDDDTVTDNKGPILATLFAVSELLEERKLTSNICFLIEGEEESGSAGFYDAVQAYKVRFVGRAISGGSSDFSYNPT